MRPSPFNRTNSKRERERRERVMACNKLHRRIALRRKLQILRTLTNSKSVKKNSIITDASLYIYKLRLQIEAIKKEYHEVRVESVGTEYLQVKVRCKKLGGEMAAKILEVFEELNLEVLEANIACKHVFEMEAIVKADIDATLLNQALLNFVQNQTQQQLCA